MILTVENTASGIRETDFENMFERFYRGDQSRSRETGGHGIGLSVARAIARAHGGDICASGEAGKRIIMTVTLTGK